MAMAREVSAASADAQEPFSVARRRALAERLQQLFDQVRRPDCGAEYSCADVARGIAAVGGPPLTPRAIERMRAGLTGRPTLEHIEALAMFFGASPTSFFRAEVRDQLRADLESLDRLPDPSVRRLVLGLARMDAQEVAVVASVVERCANETERAG